MSRANEQLKLKRQRVPPSPPPLLLSSSAAAAAAEPGPKKLRLSETFQAKADLFAQNQRKLKAVFSLLPEFGFTNELAFLALRYHGYEDDDWFNTARTIVNSKNADGNFVISVGAQLLNCTLAFSVSSDLNTRQSVLDIVTATAHNVGHPARVSEILRNARDACFYTLASKLAGELESLFFPNQKPSAADAAPAETVTFDTERSLRILDSLSNVSRIQAMLLSLPSTRNTDAENPFPVIVDPARTGCSFNLVREVVKLLGNLLVHRFPTDDEVKQAITQNIDCFWVLFAFAELIRDGPMIELRILSKWCYDAVTADPDTFRYMPTVVPAFVKQPVFTGKTVVYQSAPAHGPPLDRTRLIQTYAGSPVYVPGTPGMVDAPSYVDLTVDVE